MDTRDKLVVGIVCALAAVAIVALVGTFLAPIWSIVRALQGIPG